MAACCLLLSGHWAVQSAAVLGHRNLHLYPSEASKPSSEPPPARKCLLCLACCSTRIHQIHSRLVSSPKTASRWQWTLPFSASTVWILDCLLLLLLLLLVRTYNNPNTPPPPRVKIDINIKVNILIFTACRLLFDFRIHWQPCC